MLKRSTLSYIITMKNEPTIAVSLTVKDTAEALDFYTRAFGAEELFRMPTPDGGIGHQGHNTRERAVSLYCSD